MKEKGSVVATMRRGSVWLLPKSQRFDGKGSVIKLSDLCLIDLFLEDYDT